MKALPFDSYWLASAVGLSYLMTAGWIKLAHKFDWYDRDVHAIDPKRRQEIPTYGGVVLWTVVWGLFFSCYPIYLGTGTPWHLFIASTVVLITGMIDDRRELSPLAKSLGIVLAASWLYWQSDLRFVSHLAFLPDSFQSPWLGYLWSLVWIFLLTNAVNLIDGLDGVASGVSLMSLVTLFVGMWWLSLTLKAYVLLLIGLLAASLCGFLPYNWYPARIYLGDTGSLFIGFMFASLSVTSLKSLSIYSLIFPVVIYIVPLFDVVYATIRRLVTKQPVTQADHDHLHHRLMRLGWSPDRVSKAMMGLTAIFSSLGLLMQWFISWRHWFILIILFAVVILFSGMTYLGMRNKQSK